VPGRHVRATGERLDIQRLRILPVDPVADPAQPRKVVQVLRLGGSGGHPCSLSSRHAVLISQRRRPDQAEVVSRSLWPRPRRSDGSARWAIWRISDFGGCQTPRSSKDHA